MVIQELSLDSVLFCPHALAGHWLDTTFSATEASLSRLVPTGIENVEEMAVAMRMVSTLLCVVALQPPQCGPER